MDISRNVEIVLVVGGAFLTTTSLSSILKYLFKHEEFPYPLFVTCMHMLISSAAAYVAVTQLKMNEHTFRCFTGRDQLNKIFPIALCTAISMGCTNLALKFLYPSFVALIAAALPLVTIALALLLKTEVFNQWTYIAMVPIFSGFLLSSTNEMNFNFFGFVILVIGIVLRAMKQVLQAKVLRDSGKIDALTLLYYVAPQNFVIFLAWSMVTEGIEPYTVLAAARWQTWAVLLLSTIFAACFNLLSFRAISLINATAWSLMGMVNVPAIALVSYLLFGNSVTPAQVCGFGITLSGVYLYQQKGRVHENEYKVAKMAEGNHQEIGIVSNDLDEFGLEDSGEDIPI